MNYPAHHRGPTAERATEIVLLDENVEAEGHEFFSLGGLAVSSGQDILAYSIDTVGRRFYTIAFKDLSTGERLSDAIPDVTGGMTWAEDNRTLFYVKQDPTTLRAYQVYRHATVEYMVTIMGSAS